MNKKEVIKKIHKIINLAFELKIYGADVFVEYAPHTNQIDVRVYKDGWGSENDYSKYLIYLDDAKSNIELKKVIDNLEKLKEETYEI